MGGPHLFLAPPCHDCASYIGECIASVRAQRYRNWSMCIVVDDAGEPSGRGTVRAARKAAGGDRRVRIIKSKERHYGLRNYVELVSRYCPHDGVVCILDGDDKLSDEGALAAVGAEYAKDDELDALWTKHIRSDGTLGSGKELKPRVSPYKQSWRSSHMKTFRKRAIWGVPPELFRDENGDWWPASTDQALYLPILAIARRTKFLDRVCYFYRSGSPNRLEVQKETAKHIRARGKARASFKKRNVLLVVNGPGHAPDERLHMGERRAPLGILSMASHLRARGHGVRLVDRFLNPAWFPTDETLLDWADIVGIYISTPNAQDAEWFIAESRKRGFKGRVLAGGPHTILRPDRVLEWGANFAATFEADFAISKLVEGIPVTDEPKRNTELDLIPFPAYDLVREQGLKYDSRWPFDRTRHVMTLNTSRGCPHSCTFCDVRTLWGRKWVGQSAERILLDVDYLRREFGARGVYFREDNFGCNKARLLKFSEMNCRRVKWACELRADVGADPDIVRAMARGGCVGLYVGAESGSQAILDRMHKGIKVEQIEATCRNARANGINLALSFIVGYPGETEEDQRASEELAKCSRAKHVWRNQYRIPEALKAVAHKQQTTKGPVERLMVYEIDPEAIHVRRYVWARQFCASKRVLDAACGSGFGSAILAETADSVLGVDCSDEALEFAVRRWPLPNVRFEKLDLMNEMDELSLFDVIVSIETVEHIERPVDETVALFAEYLAGGGILVLSHPLNEVTGKHNRYHKRFRITAEKMDAALRGAGLEVITSEVIEMESKRLDGYRLVAGKKRGCKGNRR